MLCIYLQYDSFLDIILQISMHFRHILLHVLYAFNVHTIHIIATVFVVQCFHSIE